MEARRLKYGETRWVCLVCDTQTISERTEHVNATRCDECGSPFLQPVKKRRSLVRQECGGSKMADMGLALLLEAQISEK
jgi:DNA-directed RNA polymerase subunit RPC12/RpoP